MVSTKRADILDAALTLFAKRGFHGTSVPELAAAAEVGAGTIYRHFESKEGVVNALYQHWKLRFRDEVLGALPPDGSWRQRFGALWRAMFAFAAANPGACQFLDLHHHSDYLDEHSRVLDASAAAVWLEIVLAGQADEALSDADPVLLVSMTYGAFLGALRAHSSGYIPLSDEIVAQTEERVWALLRR